MKNKDSFFQVYAGLPLNLRNEVILVVNDEPITWRVAYLEIKGETKLGKRILEKLKALKFI